jgi:hypothetical protein
MVRSQNPGDGLVAEDGRQKLEHVVQMEMTQREAGSQAKRVSIMFRLLVGDGARRANEHRV